MDIALREERGLFKRILSSIVADLAMKRLPALLAATLLPALPLFAQDKAPEKTSEPAAPPAAEPGANPAPPPLAPAGKDKDRLELMPSKPAQLLPPPIDLPLIPEMPVPQERPRTRSVESPIKTRDSATSAAADEVKQRIRLREAKTKAQRDPAVMAEWTRSTEVKTDYEKREALKSYYRLLYARMARIDPSLKAPIALQLQQNLARLEQTRIAPTQPPITAVGPRAER
jgi:hypothetical protein